MSTKVVMPQMGESVFEGTVTKWLKKIGDRVDRDEPLFEVSTDKVDTEIASPAGGRLSRIDVPEGETVRVGTLLAIIEEAAVLPVDEAADAGGLEQTDSVEAEPAAGVPEEHPPSEAIPEPAPEPAAATAEVSLEAGPVAAGMDESAAVGAQAAAAEGGNAEAGGLAAPGAAGPAAAAPPVPGPVQPRTSPLVRRIARAHGIEVHNVEGTGLSGRITKGDILAHLERAGKKEGVRAGPTSAADSSLPSQAAALPAAEKPERRQVRPAAASVPGGVAPDLPTEAPVPAQEAEIVDMTPMRKAIAEHMILSRRISAHVQTVFEVDMTQVVQLRDRYKDEFGAREGIGLTVTPFFVKALVETVREFPILNCSVAGDKIVYKKPINVGVAVALETGLIVPVVKDAQNRSFTNIARAIHDLAGRARSKKLKPEEVQNGTITITNPGVYGSLFGTPIINQPQVAILGVGGLEKRPVIVNDAIAIRTMVYLALSFDHRIIDGAVADQAMAALKSRLQSWSQWAD